MNLIKFEDRCVITRDGGSVEVDEFDNPMNVKEIYEGKCRYQQGVQAYMGISVRNSIVFIPKQLKVEENDIVNVEVKDNAVKVQGIVTNPRYVELPLTGEKVTRIELSQVKEVLNEGESESDKDSSDESSDGNLNDSVDNGG